MSNANMDLNYIVTSAIPTPNVKNGLQYLPNTWC